MWFPEAGEPAVAEERWESRDVRALHEALLGVDVAGAAVAAMAGGRAGAEGMNRARAGPAATGRGRAMEGGGAELRGAGAGLFRRLARYGGRVVTTQLGAAGDHGMGGSFGLLLLGGASRERLLASEERFRDAFARRLLVRSPLRATIADSSACMSMCLGVDARELVPPFGPAGRDSDGLFGVTVRACISGGFAGFLPWSIEHVPAQARTTSFEKEMLGSRRSSVNEYVRMALAAAFEPRAVRTEDHLRLLGEVLVRLGSRPREAEHFFREETMRAIGRRLAMIERQLAEHGRRPAFWATALEGFAAVLRGALVDRAAYLPADLVAAHGEDGARAVFFAYVRDVGRLYLAWPALFAAAKDLRARGVRLSTAVRKP